MVIGIGRGTATDWAPTGPHGFGPQDWRALPLDVAENTKVVHPGRKPLCGRPRDTPSEVGLIALNLG